MSGEPEGEPRLNEFTRDEWWDVCQRANPDIARDEFDAMWDEFQAEKAARKLQ